MSHYTMPYKYGKCTRQTPLVGTKKRRELN